MHRDFNSHIPPTQPRVYTLYYMVNRPVSRNNPRNDYKIGNVLLEKVSEEREINVYLSVDLKPTVLPAESDSDFMFVYKVIRVL